MKIRMEKRIEFRMLNVSKQSCIYGIWLLFVFRYILERYFRSTVLHVRNRITHLKK